MLKFSPFNVWIIISEAEEESDDSSEESGEQDDGDDDDDGEGEDSDEDEKEENGGSQDGVKPAEGTEETVEASKEPPKKSRKGKKLMEREAERKKKRVVIEKTNVNDEYAYDSSDEEDIRNTIGNIPTNWYDEYGHIGYDLEGKKIRDGLVDLFVINHFLTPVFARTACKKCGGKSSTTHFNSTQIHILAILH